MKYKIIQVSEQSYILDFGDKINVEINTLVNLFSEKIFEDINTKLVKGILNCVPSYNKILIQFKPTKHNNNKIYRYLKKLKIYKKNEKINDKLIEIPICYNENFSSDLQEISFKINLSKENIITEHLKTIFHVYMIGFLPGFPYMGKTSKILDIERKLTPKLVHKGSVGIANRMCCIYPQNSPGGWNIIGRVPINLFSLKNLKDPLKIKSGDKIKFKRITYKEFKKYNEK